MACVAEQLKFEDAAAANWKRLVSAASTTLPADEDGSWTRAESSFSSSDSVGADAALHHMSLRNSHSPQATAVEAASDAAAADAALHHAEHHTDDSKSPRSMRPVPAALQCQFSSESSSPCGRSPITDYVKRASILRTASQISMYKAEERAKATLAAFKKPATWVVVFGTLLAMCAGIVNAVIFLVVGEFVTHHTGTTAKLGMRTQGVHFGEVSHDDLETSFLILSSFCAGSFACGLMIDKNQVHFGGKAAYGLALVANSCCLLLSMFMLPDFVGVYFACFASGIQNAMCTSHFGANVRTTHVTGTVTDIGSTLGRMVMILMRKGFDYRRLNVGDRAELQVEAKKLSVLLPLFFGFLFGCTAGAYLEFAFWKYALLFPAGITGSIGVFYFVFRQSMKAKIKSHKMKCTRQELSDAQICLELARSTLEQLKAKSAHESPVPENEDVGLDSFDDDMCHALDKLHDMEQSITAIQFSHEAHNSVDKEPLTPKRRQDVVL